MRSQSERKSTCYSGKLLIDKRTLSKKITWKSTPFWLLMFVFIFLEINFCSPLSLSAAVIKDWSIYKTSYLIRNLNYWMTVLNLSKNNLLFVKIYFILIIDVSKWVFLKSRMRITKRFHDLSGLKNNLGSQEHINKFLFKLRAPSKSW